MVRGYGERLYKNNLQVWLDKINLTPWSRKPLAFSKLLFEGDPNEITGRPNAWFANVLILTDQLLVDSDKIAKFPEQVSISLRGRDLKSAILSRSDLRNTDFTGSDLSNATLDNAILKSARFDCAHNGRADSGPPFQEDINRLARRASSIAVHQPVWPEDGCTWLQSASLLHAQMQGASLRSTRLYGTILDYAELQGADLFQAQMQGASLVLADLEGVELSGANLIAARLIGTSLIGASIRTTGSLKFGIGTAMHAALLRDVELQGVSLDNVAVSGARFERVHFYRAHGVLVDYKSAEFSEIDFKDNGYGKNFQKWVGSTLSGIESEDRRLAIREKFDILSPVNAAAKDTLTLTSLVGAALGRAGAVASSHQKGLAECLKVTICLVDQPHFVVRGLIESQRAEATGKFLSGLIEELEKASVTPEPSKCPGSKDITDKDFADLREIEANIKAGEQIF